MLPPARAEAQISRLIREDWGRILAALVSSVGDYALAEDSLQDAVVEALQAAHEVGTDATGEQEWPHKPGDTVEILEGPFKGLAAVYQMPRGEDRAALLLTMLGSEQTVVIERSSLGNVVKPAS